MSLAPRLQVEGLSKTYGQARVLRDAHLTVRAGEILALLGANGSGKSTLVKCITGVVPPDPGGRVVVDGQPLEAGFTPTAVHERGIRVVHQDAPLVPSLPVAESVALHRGYPRRAGLFTSRRAMEAETRSLLARLDVAIDPATPAWRLSAAERAMVVLALALADVDEGCQLVVLDEPTASLPEADADRFLTAVQRAAEHGVGVVLVTHRLAEVTRRCTDVTVLRDGAVVSEGAVSDFDHPRLLADIVGPERHRTNSGDDVDGVRRSARFAPAHVLRDASAPVVSVRGLHGQLINDVSFFVHPGELVGIAGIVGSGATELGRLLAGLAAPTAGEIRIGGANRSTGSVRDALRAGVAYVPGDRVNEGGIAGLSVAENVALPALGRYWRRPREAQSDYGEVIQTLDVRPPDARRAFGTLSGGNQQKVVIGKWALTRPRLFVLDDPTAGVDPGAREDIYAVLRGMQAAGTAVVLISSEPEQLVRLARRVLVVRAGRIETELEGDAVTIAAIGRAAM
jgi:ribose transport system ATP-binding protein